ncbi:MAG: ATP-binding protein [Acidobacteriaceae bacterium]|nr:ATP-binding protein [Acidobacteriaceae bacterium]
MENPRRASRLSHDARILLLALGAGLPSVLLCIILLAWDNHSARVQWTFDSLIVLCWLGFAFAARARVVGSLRTVSNLLEAMREGDYSIRGRSENPRDPLGEVMQQVNAMAATLQGQRLGALEATALLRKVMEEIDVAVFAFDPQHALRLVNRAGERLLARPAERLLGRDATSLGLAEYLSGEPERTVQRAFSGATGRWGIRRSQFREGGLPHQLIVVSDLTRPLREQELQAWQRLVRVLGHELNNSLAPIKSIAQSLNFLLEMNPLPEDWVEDMSRGLTVIAGRSESLSRFMSSYARLAKLPAPRLERIEVNALLRRVTVLETRMQVFFEECPSTTIQGDPDQLEQVLINLIRNAVDASLETGGRVFVRHTHAQDSAEITVRDEGPGLSNTGNLFVPFFTTKRGGSGIGLVLSRQIAEAHGGSLDLRNAASGPGCEAILSLPLA